MHLTTETAEDPEVEALPKIGCLRTGVGVAEAAGEVSATAGALLIRM